MPNLRTMVTELGTGMGMLGAAISMRSSKPGRQ